MKKLKKNKTALSEIKGIKHPKKISDKSVKRIKLKRKKQPSAKEFIKYILNKDITYLSQAITLIESTNPKHKKKASEIIKGCLPYANNSIRIGITGVPGVGKSTFIESLGKILTAKGEKIAVLAIDPSSSVNKGSILGDKTRMETLVKDKNAFIRPSPSGDSLGGVARKTRETIILCEAAGFNKIFIETVGVGQSETAVHSMVDFFLLLKLAGAGDELQGIKRGIIEMADAIVINKADGENKKAAKLAKMEFNRALHLYPIKESKWQPKVLTCSAYHNKGMNEVWLIIQDYLRLVKNNGYFDKNRNSQNEFWLYETINQNLKDNFYSNKKIKKILEKEIELISKNKTTPFDLAEKLLNVYFKDN
jgi:LAO/AO transport system kinase